MHSVHSISLGKLAIALLLIRALSMVFTSTFGTLTPFFVDEFGLTEAQIGLASSIMYAGSLIFVLPVGAYIDIKGSHLLLLVGIITVPLFLFMVSAATSFFILVLALFLSGIPRSMILSATEKAAVGGATPKDKKALVMGIIHSGPMLSGAALSSMLPVLAVVFGWRMGIWLIILSFVPIVYWLLKVLQITDFKESKHVEKASGLLPLLVKNPLLVLILLTSIVFMTGHIIVLSFYVYYLTDQLLVSRIAAGILLGLIQIIATFSRPIWGILSDGFFKMKRKPPLILMSLVGALSFFILSVLPVKPPIWGVSLISITIGISIISSRPLISTFAIDTVGVQDAGKMSSILLAATWSAFILSPMAFGYLITETGSWLVAWKSMAAIHALLALILFLWRPLKKQLNYSNGLQVLDH